MIRYAGKKGENGTTALIEAAKNVNIDAVKALLIEVGMCDDNGMTNIFCSFKINQNVMKFICKLCESDFKKTDTNGNTLLMSVLSYTCHQL